MNASIRQPVSPPKESTISVETDPVELEKQFEIANNKGHLHAALYCALKLLFPEPRNMKVSSLRKRARYQMMAALTCMKLSDAVPISRRMHYTERAIQYARQAAQTADLLDTCSKSSAPVLRWEALFHAAKMRRMTNSCLVNRSERLGQMRKAEKNILECIKLGQKLSTDYRAKSYAEHAQILTDVGSHIAALQSANLALTNAMAWLGVKKQKNEGEKVYIWEIWIARLKKNYDL